MSYKRHPIALLDKWAHILCFPKIIQHPICDKFDTWIGLYDEDDVSYDEPAEQDCS